LEKRIINFTQNLRRLPNGKLVFGKPKTKTSIRSIVIGDESIGVLNEQKEKIISEREDSRVKHLWREMDMVFPSTLGTPMDPSNVLKRFRQVLKKAGLPKIRFHDLRHTSAALMLNNGVDVLVAQRRSGHSKPSTTLDVYGHLLHSSGNEVGEKIETMLK